MNNTMQFATLDAITLHYAQAGQVQGTPLVFINSLGSDLRIWGAVAAHFAPHFPVLRYDKRGHGLSDSPNGPYTLAALAADLHNLLNFLEMGRVILVGVSVGGMIALHYASQHPQRVAGLVLCDTAAKLGTTDYWEERRAAIARDGMAALAPAILSRWFAPSFALSRPSEYQGYHNMLARTPVNGYLATCAALRDADLRPLVGQITTPALVLCGAEDTATPPDMVQELAAALPNARFELIRGAGHTPSVEQPAALAAQIAAFLQENGSTG